MDEQDKVVVRTEEEIRESIISELSLDAETDVERIDKLVARELDHDKKLSSAIGAKIKHRTEADELRKKVTAPVVTPPAEVKGEGLSTKDTLYLAKAPIHEDDVEEVVDYARKMGVTVREAHTFFGPILKDRDDKRKTAEATNTGTSRKSSTKVSDDELLKKATSGDLPESDDEIQRLMKIKSGKK